MRLDSLLHPFILEWWPRNWARLAILPPGSGVKALATYMGIRVVRHLRNIYPEKMRSRDFRPWV